MARTTKINTELKKLQQLLKKHKIDAYIIPSHGEFLQKSPRIKYITNFTGSSGIAIITSSQCYFFTDGRYTEQATKELDKNFKIINITKYYKWIISFIKKDNKIGFDPKLISIGTIQHLQTQISKNKTSLVPIKRNLVDIICNKEEIEKHGTISLHNLKYTGQTTNAKKNKLLKYLKENYLNTIIITDPTSICWLLNIRAFDIPFTPCINAYLIVDKSGESQLFTDAIANISVKNYLLKNNVKITPLTSFEKSLQVLKIKHTQISKQTSFFITKLLKNYKIAEDPCLIMKACKNKTELQGAINAGIQDSKALMNFFNWLDKELSKTTLTELDLADKLLQFRKKQKNFISPSFSSIVGFKENSSVIHYLPKESSNKSIKGSGILLVDSGGHYLDGTTDITRTIAIGKPTSEQIHNFTLVLKSHINLITAIFPEGTHGGQLDVLARINLWQEGKDYEHGTGHGVGSVLAVHEGPQNIGKNFTSAPLQENMIVSIEPGFYKPKYYGIRIENLVYVKKSKFTDYLEFEILTYVSIDEKLIDFKMLTEKEKIWLRNYNKKCHEIFNDT